MNRSRTGWTIFRRAVAESRRDGVPTIAQALAYSLFLAIPACALVLLGVFSIVADPTLIESVVSRAGRVMPQQATTLLEDSLQRSSEQRGGGVAMTVVGLALALWTTTSAAATLMGGLSRAYDREDERGFVRKRLVAVAIVVALVVGAALVVSLLIMGPHIERWIGSALDAQHATAWTWWTMQWPILGGGLLFVFAAVLYLGPDAEQPSWRLVMPGAIAAVVGWLVASGGFAVFVAHFGSYEKTWGTLSAVVVTLIWLWVTSMALLFGAELNAETRRERGVHDPAADARTSVRPGAAVAHLGRYEKGSA